MGEEECMHGRVGRQLKLGWSAINGIYFSEFLEIGIINAVFM